MTCHAVLTRLLEDERQTIGRLSLYQGVHAVYDCYTLELPWLDNAPMTSCIPPGRYQCNQRFSEKYAQHWILKDVTDRSMILIHHGNYHRDTQGCILVGSEVVDINSDGYLDVTRSKRTMTSLFGLIDTVSFDLTITPVIERKNRRAA